MHNTVTCKIWTKKGWMEAPMRVHQSLPSSAESVPSGRSVECSVESGRGVCFEAIAVETPGTALHQRVAQLEVILSGGGSSTF